MSRYERIYHAPGRLTTQSDHIPEDSATINLANENIYVRLVLGKKLFVIDLSVATSQNSAKVQTSTLRSLMRELEEGGKASQYTNGSYMMAPDDRKPDSDTYTDGVPLSIEALGDYPDGTYGMRIQLGQKQTEGAMAELSPVQARDFVEMADTFVKSGDGTKPDIDSKTIDADG